MTPRGFPCLVEVFILRLECSEVSTHCSDLVSFLQSSFSQQPLGGTGQTRAATVACEDVGLMHACGPAAEVPVWHASCHLGNVSFNLNGQSGWFGELAKGIGALLLGKWKMYTRT